MTGWPLVAGFLDPGMRFLKTAASYSRQVFAKKSDCGVIERTYRPLVVGMVLSKINDRPKFFCLMSKF